MVGGTVVGGCAVVGGGAGAGDVDRGAIKGAAVLVGRVDVEVDVEAWVVVVRRCTRSVLAVVEEDGVVVPAASTDRSWRGHMTTNIRANSRTPTPARTLFLGIGGW